MNYDQIWYTGVFEVADHDLAIIHSTLYMTDQIWRLKILKKLRLILELEYMGFRGEKSFSFYYHTPPGYYLAF